jgi:hypothetical protein
MKRLALALSLVIAPAALAQSKAEPPKSVRLYVFDCGSLTMSDPATFGFTKEEIGDKQPFAVPCYLVVHPKGTLISRPHPRQSGQRDYAGNLDGHENSKIPIGRGGLLGCRYQVSGAVPSAFRSHRQCQ